MPGVARHGVVLNQCEIKCTIDGRQPERRQIMTKDNCDSMPECVVADRPTTRFRYCKTHEIWEVNWGDGWHFQQRNLPEIREMHPSLAIDPAYTADADEDERELFGETLDNLIPDDLYEMLQG
jgi:hypothetical protein